MAWQCLQTEIIVLQSIKILADCLLSHLIHAWLCSHSNAELFPGVMFVLVKYLTHSLHMLFQFDFDKFLVFFLLLEKMGYKVT